jgi:LuxR family maltose regulon positive regulatory protein
MPIHTREAVIAILDWLQSLPAAALDARPSLRVLSATISLVAGRTGGVEEALGEAERALQGAEPDEKQRDLIGRIAAARATLAVTRYEPEAIMVEARRALEYLHPDDVPFRMTALWVMAMAHSMQGDRAAVRRVYGELEAASRIAGDVFFAQLALCGLAETREWDNRLHEAAEGYRRALKLFGEHPQPNASEAHLGLARVLYEWNDVDAAEEEGERSLQLARQYDHAVDRFILGELFLARIKLARGNIAGAEARLDELESMTRARSFLHRLPAIAALRVQVSLAQGDVDEAERRAGAFELPLSRARVRLARHESASALALLEPLRLEMEARDWQDEGLKVLVLQALALRADAREDEALRVLGLTMDRAERGGFVRFFLDEGEPMAALLSAARARGLKPGYSGALLAAFAAERERRERASAESAAAQAQALVDPLSERELEVLRLVSEGLSNQEIGERLFLALDTIKGHNRRIFDKLEVRRRTEAIARARELGLI